MGFLSKLVRLGLLAGVTITAFQASEKSKKKNGKIDAEAFVKNLKEQAVSNSKLVVDTLKSSVGAKPADGEYRVSDEGENGYSYPDSKGDKVTEIFEDMKEKAPEVIGKVQDFVEDLREKAPLYKEKAQNIVESVKEAAKTPSDEDKKDAVEVEVKEPTADSADSAEVKEPAADSAKKDGGEVKKASGKSKKSSDKAKKDGE